MPIDRLLEGAAFEPDAVNAMSDAYEECLRRLPLVDRNDPLAEILAGRIIECAKTGERDPARLCTFALRNLGK